QTTERRVCQRHAEKEWGFDGSATDDGRYLVITVWRGTEHKQRVFYQDLQSPDAPVLPLIDAFEAEYAFIDNDGPVFYFRSDLDAPRGRIVAIDVCEPK